MNKETERLKTELAEFRRRNVIRAEMLMLTKARTAIIKRKIKILTNQNGLKVV